MGALHDTCISESPAEAGTPYLRAHLEKEGSVLQQVQQLLELVGVGVRRDLRLERVAKPAGGRQLQHTQMHLAVGLAESRVHLSDDLREQVHAHVTPLNKRWLRTSSKVVDAGMDFRCDIMSTNEMGSELLKSQPCTVGSTQPSLGSTPSDPHRSGRYTSLHLPTLHQQHFHCWILPATMGVPGSSVKLPQVSCLSWLAPILRDHSEPGPTTMSTSHWYKHEPVQPHAQVVGAAGQDKIVRVVVQEHHVVGAIGAGRHARAGGVCLPQRPTQRERVLPAQITTGHLPHAVAS